MCLASIPSASSSRLTSGERRWVQQSWISGPGMQVALSSSSSCPLTPAQPPHCVAMRAACLFLLFLPAIRCSSLFSDNPDYYDYQEATSRPSEEQFQFQSQQQVQQEVIPAPTFEPGNAETEPTEPGPLDCREEQYPCTRLYSIHKPCKQCLNEVCFYSLRRMYIINKEICVRTVCAHEELLRADLCRDKFSKCGVMASSGLCQSVAASCARSCGGC
ncbi:LOW QUALITY PROTEIN: microfibrillar-associated protein 2 [Pteropus vampyrus]|uniref:LOW QUALITY PROTEIN: microfibrillar-associated protein 2 n=1 Tax=Pteropus vampyrus TaxID=132908 RepID=A0A6P3QD00_PTEVA|nr:LOW QUALITY PROTEIN: microfibrillar-associated protein 2 [Pteropus vampyrus]